MKENEIQEAMDILYQNGWMWPKHIASNIFSAYGNQGANKCLIEFEPEGCWYRIFRGEQEAIDYPKRDA